jgi:hypothetical protein
LASLSARDRSDELTALRKRLLTDLRARIRSTGNQIPGLNPNFDARRWFVEARPEN